MEFKDIDNWQKSGGAKAYEDNVNFYPTRYTRGAMYTSRYLLQQFAAKSETLGKELFLPGVYGGSSYSIRLNALKLLYEEVGFDWDESWSAYTTDIVR